MQHLWNAHAGRAADQASWGGALIQEHGDEAKAEGYGGRESVRIDGVQPYREGGIRYA